MKFIEMPTFTKQKDLLKFLVENKSTLITQKKYYPKYADSIEAAPMTKTTKDSAYKSNEPINDPPGVLETKIIINTTNLMDSHDDVHFPGIWDKSLKENKNIMHLQEHEARKFSHIISDGTDLKAYAESFTWKELGFDWSGKTEALTFESSVRKSRNEYMHDQYAKGYVKNHSVGMNYVRLALAVNDKSYGAEYEIWEKYLDQIVNKEIAEEKGYFWAVREAKVIEGSAVPRGSNYVTPTLENNMKFAPPEGTQTQEPPDGTPKRNYNEIINQLKF